LVGGVHQRASPLWSGETAPSTIHDVIENVLQANLEDEQRTLLNELLLRGNLDDLIPQLARDWPDRIGGSATSHIA